MSYGQSRAFVGVLACWFVLTVSHGLAFAGIPRIILAEEFTSTT